MPLNLTLGLYMLQANRKPGIASFKISLIILQKTSGTTQRISSFQLLPYEAEADKIHKGIFNNFLVSWEEVGVI